MSESSAPDFAVSEIGGGLFRIVDVLGNHCYLVVGERRVLLVDTCWGMGNLRACCDTAESVMPKDTWPYPSYIDIMMSVR